MHEELNLDKPLTAEGLNQAREEFREQHGNEAFGPHLDEVHTPDRVITSADIPLEPHRSAGHELTIHGDEESELRRKAQVQLDETIPEE